MNFYNEIKQKLIDNEIYEKVKDYSKERNRVITYYEVGKLLVKAQGGEERAKYGDNLIKEYSDKLVKEVNKKYDITTLKRMRKFYFLIQKGAPLAHQLSWSNYVEILPINDINASKYYIDICINQNLTKRQLREKIKSKEYERLPEETKIKLVNKDESNVQDFIKNPIVIHNPNNINVVKEKVLQKLILEDIPTFFRGTRKWFYIYKK